MSPMARKIYDAVNVRQLNRLSKRTNRVGASAAALASLKPAQLGKNDKFAFSLGFGSYKNAQAVAMGAVFKPAENVLLNVAGSFAGPGFRRGGFLEIRRQTDTCSCRTKRGASCKSFAIAAGSGGVARPAGRNRPQTAQTGRNGKRAATVAPRVVRIEKTLKQ